LKPVEAKTLVVVVGSSNPTKVKAVEETLRRAVSEMLLPRISQFEVHSLEVESGVSAQPVGDEETIRGATTRAEAVLKAMPQTDWGVGIEGGVVQHQTMLMTTAWCVIRDRLGNISFGGGLMLPLPPAIVRDLETGLELGDATDRLYRVQGSKRAGGVVGHLSKGLETRQQAYESIFTYALVKFLNPEIYELGSVSE